VWSNGVWSNRGLNIFINLENNEVSKVVESEEGFIGVSKETDVRNENHVSGELIILSAGN
jgi:hypothetical protein